jgi:hypothetical protein
MAPMKHLSWILLLSLVAYCPAQNLCTPSTISQAAARVLALQKELGQTKVDEMDEGVPPAVADKIIQLKDALSHTSDVALAWRVAPIPGYFQTTNEGAPGPSHSGTGDATDFNPESVRDAAGQSPYVAQCSQIGWVPHPLRVFVFAASGSPTTGLRRWGDHRGPRRQVFVVGVI